MKLHDLMRLLGDLLYIIAAIALGHLLIAKVLMAEAPVDIGMVIAILAGLVATKLIGEKKG